LKAAFEKHERETEEQVSRLEQVFDLLAKKPQGKNCPAILGIIEEGQEIMKEYKARRHLMQDVLSAAQSVEHYEISRYGTLTTRAEELGLKRAVRVLKTTLEEEKKTDQALSALAETCVNQRKPPRRSSHNRIRPRDRSMIERSMLQFQQQFVEDEAESY
jgi:ferritin-like metal-binding protein YciE